MGHTVENRLGPAKVGWAMVLDDALEWPAAAGRMNSTLQDGN